MTPDRTEVLELGNHGIDPGTWTGWDGPSERVGQCYPQPGDLPPHPVTADVCWPQLPPARSSEPVAPDSRTQEVVGSVMRKRMVELRVVFAVGLVIGFAASLLTPWSPL